MPKGPALAARSQDHRRKRTHSALAHDWFMVGSREAKVPQASLKPALLSGGRPIDRFVAPITHDLEKLHQRLVLPPSKPGLHLHPPRKCVRGRGGVGLGLGGGVCSLRGNGRLVLRINLTASLRRFGFIDLFRFPRGATPAPRTLRDKYEMRVGLCMWRDSRFIKGDKNVSEPRVVCARGDPTVARESTQCNILKRSSQNVNTCNILHVHVNTRVYVAYLEAVVARDLLCRGRAQRALGAKGGGGHRHVKEVPPTAALDLPHVGHDLLQNLQQGNGRGTVSSEWRAKGGTFGCSNAHYSWRWRSCWCWLQP